MCWNCRNCLSKIKHCLSPKWSALILDDEMAPSSKSHISCFFLNPTFANILGKFCAWKSVPQAASKERSSQPTKERPPSAWERHSLWWRWVDCSGDLCLQAVSGEVWGLLTNVRALWETGRHPGVLEECCRNQLLTVILKMLLTLRPQMWHFLRAGHESWCCL